MFNLERIYVRTYIGNHINNDEICFNTRLLNTKKRSCSKCYHLKFLMDFELAKCLRHKLCSKYKISI